MITFISNRESPCITLSSFAESETYPLSNALFLGLITTEVKFDASPSTPFKGQMVNPLTQEH